MLRSYHVLAVPNTSLVGSYHVHTRFELRPPRFINFVLIVPYPQAIAFAFLSKTSQIIFDLHPGFFHMEDEKGNKLHLFKKCFKMTFFYYTSHH